MSATIAFETEEFPSSNVHAIPELADHWKALDFREILSRRAAFVSVSQSNSLYREGGVQFHERHDLRGSLPATIRVLEAARNVSNFVSYNWVGYSLFRDDYPKTDFDAVQYAAWTQGREYSPEERAWDDALVSDLRERVRPGDNEFYEKALQTAFVGTPLPRELTRKKVEVIVFTGIHLDWCVEGNARAARDAGYLPIIIGDATGSAHPETEAATFERINAYFAPVITSAQFVELLGS